MALFCLLFLFVLLINLIIISGSSIAVKQRIWHHFTGEASPSHVVIFFQMPCPILFSLSETLYEKEKRKKYMTTQQLEKSALLFQVFLKRHMLPFPFFSFFFYTPTNKKQKIVFVFRRQWRVAMGLYSTRSRICMVRSSRQELIASQTDKCNVICVWSWS